MAQIRTNLLPQRRRISRLLAALLAPFCGWSVAQTTPPAAPAVPAGALPQGGQVRVGSGSISQAGNLLLITQQSGRLGIDWSSFDIGRDATVRFSQPGRDSVALNRITGHSGSRIFGQLEANGQVFLSNPYGVLFAPGSKVDVGGLVATTLDLSQADFAAGTLRFSGDGDGSVVNEGDLSAEAGGYLALLAPTVDNRGSLTVAAGSVVLASGRTATVSISGHGLISAAVDAGAAGAVLNSGTIQADGGSVRLTAASAEALAQSLVNNTGLVRADALENRSGEIWITGDRVESSGTLQARGAGRIDGGHITLQGGMASGALVLSGQIDATAEGGRGGRVDTSAAQVHIAAGTQVNTLSLAGNHGSWRIDPTDFTVAAGSGPDTGSSIGALTLASNLGLGNVELATAPGGSEPGDIFVNADVSWSASTVLTLTAARHVLVNANVTATGGGAGLAVNTGAGGAFTLATGARVRLPGANSTFTLDGNAYTMIRTLAQLQAIDGDSTALSGRYALADDLDASASAVDGFSPIGNEASTGVSTANSFRGSFQGLGHTITGLVIDTPASDAAGLFASVQNARIENLTLAGGQVAGSNSVGALAGVVAGTTAIDNVHASMTVSAVDDSSSGVRAGGLVGNNSDTLEATYSRSSASGAVTADTNTSTAYVGGLAGITARGSLNEVSASGNVTATLRAGSTNDSAFYVGGLVGLSSSTIANASASGNVSGGHEAGGLVGRYTPVAGGGISDSSASGSVSGSDTAGGLVGSASSSATGVGIVDSTASGMVTSAGTAAGGLVGQYGMAGALERVGASGNVTGNTYAGGLVGYVTTAAAIDTATATGETVTAARIVGGLVGYGGSGTISNVSAQADVLANSTSGVEVGGLAGRTGGTVSNASASGSVTASNATGQVYAGGLVGAAEGGTSVSFTDVAATGAVTVSSTSSSTRVGGLIGHGSLGNITRAEADGAVSGGLYAGGLVGYYAASSGTVSDSIASGSVSGFGDAGGLIGNASGTGTITASSASGAVTSTASSYYSVGGVVGVTTLSGGVSDLQASGSVSGGAYTGGVIGNHANGSVSGLTTTITDISGSGWVGGLVGYSSNASISGLDSAVNVTHTGTTGGAGGVVGYLNGSITGSSASGDVTATGTGNIDLGGLVGEVANGAITASSATGQVSGGNATGGLVGRYAPNSGNLLSDSSASGDVFGAGSAGGLVGVLSGSGGVADSGATGTVSSTGSESGANYVGGAVGQYGGNVGPVGLTASGDVSGGQITGGVIGYLSNSTVALPTGSVISVVPGGHTKSVTGPRWVGGLVGYSDATGLAEGLGFSGNVEATGSSGAAGGLFGRSAGPVSDSSTSGNVSGLGDVGGLVGRAQGSGGFTDVASVATVSNGGSSGAVGGLVGYYNHGGTLLRGDASGQVTGGAQTGGLVGWASSGTAGTGIQSSGATGDVTSTSGTYVGGLVGRYTMPGEMTAITASGDVLGGSNSTGGLVGYYNSSGALSNATHSGVMVTATSGWVGGLVGYADAPTISNVTALAEVRTTGTGTVNIGGLAGRTAGAVSDASASGDVITEGATGSVNAGGLIGQKDGTGALTDVSATGTVTVASSSGNAVGGLVGYVSGGDVVRGLATGDVTGGRYVGGLVGYYSPSTGSISDSDASGDVSGFGDAGGLVGFANGTGGIADSTAGGSVSSSDAGSYSVGGAVGYFGMSGSLANVTAAGNVSGGGNTGGVVGYHYSTAVLDDVSTTAATVSGASWVGGIVGNSRAASISGLAATANVTHTGNGGGAGGLVGYSNGGIDNSTASGSVVGSSSNGDIGGLAGQVVGTVTDSAASGAVTGGNGDVGGLAGYVNGAVSNSTASGAVNGGNGYLGGLVGQHHNGALTQLTATGNVTGGASSTAGGLIGYSNNAGDAVNLRAEGDVTAGSNAGGLFGLWQNGTRIVDSQALGQVASGGYAGGLVGQANSNDVGIVNSSASGSVRGSTYVGGLVGYASYSSIDRGLASGAVTAVSTNGGTVYAGGLVGYFLHYTAGGTIVDSTASGAVLADANGSDAGGLVGRVDSGSIERSSASGTVTAQDSSGSSTSHRAGGLVGRYSSYVDTVFADNAATGRVISAGDAGGLVAIYNGYPDVAAPTNVSASGDVSGHGTVGGLFGSLNYIGLENGSAIGNVLNTDASGRTGGLVGRQYRYYAGSTISDSRATGEVSGGYYAGGLVGEVTDYSYHANTVSYGVIASQASGDVSDAYIAGGLVGRYYGGYGSGANANTPSDLGIRDSVASGDVQASYTAGGLVGSMASYGGVVGSRASGDVTIIANGSGAMAGGLVGELSAYSGTAGDGRIQESTASGNVTLAAGTGPGANDYYTDLRFGGLAGWINGPNAGAVTVSDSYATGNVSAVSDGGRVRAGGLVGSTDSSLERTYATGAVNGTGYAGTALVGGLVGELRRDGVTAEASYWATDASGQATSAAGTASTLAAMRDPATFDGWDIATAGASTAVWRQYEGQTLPLLRRFLTPLTLTLGDVSRAYDGTAGLGSGTLDFGGVLVDDPGAIVVDGAAVDVGSYAINAGNLVSTQAGYDLDISGSATLTITPRVLTLSGVVLDKVYDGTTTATLAASPAFGNLVAGEDLLFVPGGSFAAAFADRHAGIDKTVVLSGSYGISDGTLGKASNYSLPGGLTTTATITPKGVTVGAITAVDRVYDGTTAVAVNAAAGTLTGVIGGDVVAFDPASVTTGSIPDKNVGTRPVTVIGAALTGADAGNYAITGLDGITVQITPKALTLDGMAAYDRDYDTGTYISINSTGATLTGVVAGDLVLPQTNGVYGRMADKHVGVGKPVEIIGAGLRGPDALNYTMTPGVVTVDIAPLALTVYLNHAGASSRAYDGTTAAETSFSTSQWWYADDLGIAATSIGFADKNVAYNGSGQVVSKTITASGISLSGSDAGNYVLQNTTATLQGTITPKALTVTGVAAVDRVYDGTVNVQVDIGSAAIDTGGVVAGDTVSVLVPGSGTVTGLMADKHAGTDKAVTVPGLSLTGSDAGNYSITGSGSGVTVDIARRDLTATYTGQDKVYDGTQYARVTSTLDAVVDGDSVSQYINDYCSYIYYGCAVFTDAGGTPDSYTGNRHAGIDKPIVVVYNALLGNDAANYRLLNPTGSATPADVTPKPITLAFNGDSKVYDGMVAATVTFNRSASGIVGGDTVDTTQSANFTGDGAKNVGSGKAIAVADILLSGTHAGNYTVLNDTATTTGSITARAVVVSGIVAASRAYDGTTTVAVSAPGTIGSSGFVDGDTVSVMLPPEGLSTGTITSPDVGAARPVTVTGLTLEGADAANYLIDPAASGITVDITPRLLTASYTGVSKVYDGGVSASVVSTTAGIIDGDLLNFTQLALYTGTGAKNVGTGKAIAVSDIRLSGADAGNYALASTTAQTTGDITPKPVAPLYTGGSRVYDGTGNLSAPVTGSSLGFINTDTVGLGQTAVFTGDGSAGTGKAVAVSNIVLVGADAGNYTLTGTTASTTATVTPRPIRVAGVTALDRVYDGTTTVQVNVSNASVDTSTVIGGDDVDIALPPEGISTGNVADRFVGNNKTVTISGAVLTGADAGNYQIVGATGLVVDITPRALTAVYTAADKVYDGTANAGITATSADLLGVDAGGVAILASGVFSDGRNAGTDKAVAVTGGFLSGAFAGNYTLVNVSGSTTADITPRPLTLSYIGGERIYDGTVAAPVTSSLGNRIGGDVLTLTQTAVFTGDGAKNVGNAKPIGISSIVLGGADAGNYVLPADTATASGRITPRPVVVEGLEGVQAVDRVYDGTLLVDVNVPTGISGTPRAGDLIAGDDVLLSLPPAGAAVGRMADRHAGTNKPVLVDGLGLSGADAGNYVISAASGVTVDITPLTISAAYAGIDRVYDGSSNAPVAVTLAGVLAGDLLSGSASGLFTDGKNVGLDKPVAVSGGQLIGLDAGNYRLDNTTGSTTASVTPRSVTAVYVGGTRVYDGSTAAPVTGSVDGMVAGDSLLLSQSAAFTDGKNVGSDKPVTVSAIALSGADAGNYQLTGDTAGTTASVTPRPVVIEGLSVSAEGREYDGSTSVVVQVTAAGGAGPRAGDLIAGDDVSVLVPATGTTTGQMADKHAGTGKAIVVDGLGLSGADAANYQIVGSEGLTVDIAQRTLTVSWAGVSRVYDGTDLATAIGSGDRVVAGDDLAIGGSGVFEAGRNAGSGLTVRIETSTLGGADAANYVLANPTGSALADITPRQLTVTYTGGTRVYDGTVAAPVIGALGGLIEGDSVSLTQTAVFTGDGAKNVGTDKAVAVSSIALQGSDAGNYSPDVTTAATTASVTPRPVVLEGLTASATSREYDGTTGVVVDLVAAAGVAPRAGDLIAGDDVGVTVPGTGQTLGHMADKHVGTGKAVVIDGLGLTGADAGNYVIEGVQGVSVDITPRTLTAVWVGVDKVYDGTAVGTATGTGDRAVAGDDLSLAASGVFAAGRNAGNGLLLSFDNGVLGGADAGNYQLLNPAGSVTASILPRTVTAVYTGVDKVYDGTMAAQVSGVLEGAIDGDVLTLTQTAVFSGDRNVGTGKAVTVGGITLGGDDAANYVLADSNASTTASITPRPLTVTGLGGLVATDRDYDGTRVVALTGALEGTAGLDGLVAGDDVSLGVGGAAPTQGLMLDKHVGVDKGVVIEGLSLSGADALNYVLADTLGLTVTISPRALTASGLVAIGRVYDGSTLVALDTSGAALAGAVVGDDLRLRLEGATASMADKHAGVDKAVVLDGAALDGADAGNYRLVADGDLRVTITPRALQVTAVAEGKVYDGSASASVTVSDDRLAGDSLTLGSSASFASAGAGVAKSVTVGLSLGGDDAGNYLLPADTLALTADIERRALELVAPTLAKDYGDAIVLDGSEFSALGLVAGETIGRVQFASDGLAATAAAGNYTLAIGDAQGGSFDPANYVLTYRATALLVSPRPLTLSALLQSKVYGDLFSFSDGSYAVGGRGLANGETLGGVDIASAGAAAGAGVGVYDITIGNAGGGSFSAANYAITYEGGTLTVAPRPLTVATQSVVRFADEPNPTSFGYALGGAGLASGDVLAGVLQPVPPGSVGAAGGSIFELRPTGLSFSTGSAANYEVRYVSGLLIVLPTPPRIDDPDGGTTGGDTQFAVELDPALLARAEDALRRNSAGQGGPGAGDNAAGGNAGPAELDAEAAAVIAALLRGETQQVSLPVLLRLPLLSIDPTLRRQLLSAVTTAP
ncbi:MAG: filamentous hemagglutinin N-terminal domain-containing protein [Burkholderiaceae bacterium]|nr:filamentous hemagglutinin N-terminal domain-containing protein [Burkholderiaceae bacterium]